MIDGGYEEGYRNCACFWGEKPGSLVTKLLAVLPQVDGLKVLDAGCGEGKNAHALSMRGASVIAIDCSHTAISNGKKAWGDNSIDWVVGDIVAFDGGSENFDVIISYGLFHCLADEIQIGNVVDKLKQATKIGGYNVICTFNDREQDLSAHPEFDPCLLSHCWYEDVYKDWEFVFSSDEDLFETHPHNLLPHQHSLSRLLVRRQR